MESKSIGSLDTKKENKEMRKDNQYKPNKAIGHLPKNNVQTVVYL